MKRGLLLLALTLATGALALQVDGTFAGLADSSEAGASFTADLCAEEECKIVRAGGLDDHDCKETEWHFVITNVDGETAPRSVHVTWSEDDAAVRLEQVTGETAHYRTSSHLDQSVEKATARIHEDWEGNFRLGDGPCHQL